VVAREDFAVEEDRVLRDFLTRLRPGEGGGKKSSSGLHGGDVGGQVGAAKVLRSLPRGKGGGGVSWRGGEAVAYHEGSWTPEKIKKKKPLGG